MKITERTIAKAKLSPPEARVMRVELDLPAAGRENSKTRRWVKGLDRIERRRLLKSANEKVQRVLEEKGAEG